MARNMIAIHPSEEALYYPPSLVHGRYPVPLEPETAHIAPDALPSAGGRRGRRAATGADIDVGGRRGGRPEGAEDEEGWDDKEMLPAYESVAVGGPPRYVLDTNSNAVECESPFVIAMPEPALVATEDVDGSRSRSSERETAQTQIHSDGDAPHTSEQHTPDTTGSAGRQDTTRH